MRVVHVDEDRDLVGRLVHRRDARFVEVMQRPAIAEDLVDLRHAGAGATGRFGGKRFGRWNDAKRGAIGEHGSECVRQPQG